MFHDRERKQKLKTALVISTIVLSVFFLILLLYGFIVVSPSEIEKASKLGQYYEFNSSYLPSKNNTIKKDFNSRTHNSNLEKVSEVLENSTNSAKDIGVPLPARGRIAILVGNLGLNPLSTELALSLPKEVSLGFMPYTAALKSLLVKAQDDGHEVFIYLPFETKRYPDDFPGQMPLLTSLSDEENVKRMNMLLHAFDGYAGVYGTPNEIFTSNPSKVGAILNELFSNKLKLLTSNGVLANGEMENSIISSKIIIDAEPTIAAIKKQLDTLVNIAKSGKTSIGYASSYPVTIYTIKSWIPTIEAMGIEIVPITQTLRQEVKQ